VEDTVNIDNFTMKTPTAQICAKKAGLPCDSLRLRAYVVGFPVDEWCT
jgi:hypothetical protein